MTIRKKSSKEFKLAAISAVLEQGCSQTEAARDLTLNAKVISRHEA